MKRLALLLVGIAVSPVLHAENLLDVYREAQGHDATIASARAAYRAGMEKLPQGRALLLPSVNLGANTTRTEQDIEYQGAAPFPGGSRSFNSHGYSVSLTQPVYRKQNFALYEESKYQVEQAQSQLASAQQDLIIRVAQAYFDVLLAQDTMTFTESQKKAIAEQLDQAKRNFEVGTATIVDTNEAQARYDLVVSQQIAAENDLEVKRRALERIIGKIPGSLAPLAAKLPVQPPQPAVMDKWAELAEQNNPQLKFQKAGYEIASQEVERNRGAEYPTVDLVASYGKNSASSGSFGVGSDTTTKAIGLQLNVPLYQGGGLSSRVREAAANKDKAREDLTDARRQVVLQTRQAFLGVTSGEAQVRALEQALKSSQTALDSTKLGFEVGVRTNVDVLNAQQQVYSAERDLAQARYNYIMSLLKLKTAAGILSDSDLALVNGWLATGK